MNYKPHCRRDAAAARALYGRVVGGRQCWPRVSLRSTRATALHRSISALRYPQLTDV